MKYAIRRPVQLTGTLVGLLMPLFVLAVVWQRPAELVTVSTYEAADTIEAAAAFVGNELIFEARVIATDAARMTRPTTRPTDDLPSVAYVPVRVVVTHVHQGEVRQGEVATLRALGGTVDGTTYLVEGAPSADVYSPGTDLLVFAADMVDTGDGVVAATPNWIFRATPDGRLESVVHGGSVGSLDTAREMIVTER
jgi:hypothetical protein